MLSICVEKSVVPVGNQMERAFSLEIFRKKEYLQRYSFFPFSPEMTGNFLFHFCSSLLANRARSTNEPKNAKIYPLNRSKIPVYFKLEMAGDCKG